MAKSFLQTIYSLITKHRKTSAKRSKKQKLVKMVNPDLPQEILFEIFSRLPTKSVGKCRILSKSWNTNLSTSNFIKNHLINRKQTIQQQQNLALTGCWEVFIITSPTKKEELFQKLMSQSFRRKDLSSSSLKLLGSCNGLLLLNGPQGLMLMNPITRKLVTLHPNYPFPQRSNYSAMLGFGYDSCSDDYKIVHISYYKSLADFKTVATYVYVYSVRNGVWKKIDDGCNPFGEFVLKSCGFEGWVFVNGALHCLVCSNEGYRSCIAAFDLANEGFREIPLPKEFVRQRENSTARALGSNGVSVVGGCLLIVDNHGDGLTDVWIMKEYGVEESWVKFRIQSEDGYFKWDKIVATLCYVEEGELLCLSREDYLFACDLKEGTVRRVVLGECDARFYSGIAFVDSLVSPEGPW